jgi:hypothetical protein
MLNVVHCPACSLKLNVPEELLRKRVMCPTCGKTFDADSWLEEPDELITPSPGSPERPTEKYQGSPHQEPAAVSGSPREPHDGAAPPHPPMHGGAAAAAGRMPFGPSPWVGPFHPRPAKVEAIGIMMLVGGIIALSVGAGERAIHIFPLWPYSIILGIMAIVRGIRLLRREGFVQSSPKTIAIMQIVNIINLDVPNLIMGIIALSFLNDPVVRKYFRN